MRRINPKITLRGFKPGALGAAQRRKARGCQTHGVSLYIARPRRVTPSSISESRGSESR